MHYVSINHGFAEVTPAKATILTDTAELAGEIDVERARAAKTRAEEKLKSSFPRGAGLPPGNGGSGTGPDADPRRRKSPPGVNIHRRARRERRGIFVQRKRINSRFFSEALEGNVLSSEIVCPFPRHDDDLHLHRRFCRNLWRLFHLIFSLRSLRALR